MPDGFKLAERTLYQFKNLEIVGKNYKLNYSKSGYIGMVGQRMKIQLVQ